MGIQSTNSRIQSLSPEESADWLLGNNSHNVETLEEAKKTDRQAIVTSINQFRDVNWRQLMNSIPISSLWVHGNSDPAISNPTSEQLNNLPESAQFLIFAKSGHYPMIDEPGKFNRLLTDFINLPPGEDPCQLEIKTIWKRRVR
jgi:pimeloyl-ACP methyl ester carboxylesterase